MHRARGGHEPCAPPVHDARNSPQVPGRSVRHAQAGCQSPCQPMHDGMPRDVLPAMICSVKKRAAHLPPAPCALHERTLTRRPGAVFRLDLAACVKGRSDAPTLRRSDACDGVCHWTEMRAGSSEARSECYGNLICVESLFFWKVISGNADRSARVTSRVLRFPRSDCGNEKWHRLSSL